MSGAILKLSGVTALSLAGLLEFTKKMTEPLADIQKLHETYGIATNTIQTFIGMGKDFDITAEGMQSSLVHLNRAMGLLSGGMGTAGRGGKYLTAYMAGLGLHVKDANGHVKDMRTFLGDVAERMTTMSGVQQNLLVSRLGLDPHFVNMMRNGRAEFEKLYDAAQKGIPKFLTPEAIAQAEEFEMTNKRVHRIFENLAKVIAITLMPAFKEAMDNFLAWWNKNGEKVIERLQYWVGLFAHWIGSLADLVKDLADHTDVLTIAMALLGVAFAIITAAKIGDWVHTAVQGFKAMNEVVIMLTKALWSQAAAEAAAEASIWWIVGIAAGLAIIIGLVLLLIDDFETWRKGGISVIGTFLAWLNKATGPMGAFRDLVATAWGYIKKEFDAAWAAIKEALGNIGQIFVNMWPIIKPILIALGIAIGVVALAVIGLALGIIWAGAKIISVFAKLAAFSWKALLDPSAAWKEFKQWIDNSIEYILGIKDRIAAALKDVFLQAANALGEFLENVMTKVIVAAVELLSKITGGLSKKIGLDPEAIKKTLETANAAHQVAAEAGMRAAHAEAKVAMGATPAEALAGMKTVAPLPPGALQKTPFMDTSKVNSDNSTQNNTIHVDTPEQALKMLTDLQEKQKAKGNKPILPPVTMATR